MHISHNSPIYGYLGWNFQAEIHLNKDQISILCRCYNEHSVKLKQFVLRIERNHVYTAWAKRSVPAVLLQHVTRAIITILL